MPWDMRLNSIKKHFLNAINTNIKKFEKSNISNATNTYQVAFLS